MICAAGNHGAVVGGMCRVCGAVVESALMQIHAVPVRRLAVGDRVWQFGAWGPVEAVTPSRRLAVIEVTVAGRTMIYPEDAVAPVAVADPLTLRPGGSCPEPVGRR
jgi:hypothetical protein